MFVSFHVPAPPHHRTPEESPPNTQRMDRAYLAVIRTQPVAELLDALCDVVDEADVLLARDSREVEEDVSAEPGAYTSISSVCLCSPPKPHFFSSQPLPARLKSKARRRSGGRERGSALEAMCLDSLRFWETRTARPLLGSLPPLVSSPSRYYCS